MKTLHIVAGESAAGSVRQALDIAGRTDEVLAFRDDLSCGPIASDQPSARADWWQQQIDWPAFDEDLQSFWQRADASTDKIVVWFGRHSAQELAFRLAWASHRGDRPYHIIDVTGLCVPWRGRDGTGGLTTPIKAVSVVSADGLATLVGSEQPRSIPEDVKHQEDWARLKAENAPFRVVTPTGLISAPIDYFDHLLLEQASPEWKKIAVIIGGAFTKCLNPYMQVGDLALHRRVIALIDSGKLVAEGDPSSMRDCRVKLA